MPFILDSSMRQWGAGEQQAAAATLAPNLPYPWQYFPFGCSLSRFVPVRTRSYLCLDYKLYTQYHISRGALCGIQERNCTSKQYSFPPFPSFKHSTGDIPATQSHCLNSTRLCPGSTVKTSWRACYLSRLFTTPRPSPKQTMWGHKKGNLIPLHALA